MEDSNVPFFWIVLQCGVLQGTAFYDMVQPAFLDPSEINLSWPWAVGRYESELPTLRSRVQRYADTETHFEVVTFPVLDWASGLAGCLEFRVRPWAWLDMEGCGGGSDFRVDSVFLLFPEEREAVTSSLMVTALHLFA